MSARCVQLRLRLHFRTPNQEFVPSQSCAATTQNLHGHLKVGEENNQSRLAFDSATNLNWRWAAHCICLVAHFAKRDAIWLVCVAVLRRQPPLLSLRPCSSRCLALLSEEDNRDHSLDHHHSRFRDITISSRYQESTSSLHLDKALTVHFLAKCISLNFFYVGKVDKKTSLGIYRDSNIRQ